jgi:VanZ family protein
MAERPKADRMPIKDLLMKWTTLAALYLFWPGVALVTWGELTPSPPAWTSHFWDKSLHFVAYFGLASMATLTIGIRRPLIGALIGLALFGGALEILQGLTGRDPDLRDEIANCFGIAAGYLIAWGFTTVLGDRLLVAAKARD